MKNKKGFVSSTPVIGTLNTSISVENKWATFKDHLDIILFNLWLNIDMVQKRLDLDFIILNFEFTLGIEIE